MTRLTLALLLFVLPSEHGFVFLHSPRALHLSAPRSLVSPLAAGEVEPTATEIVDFIRDLYDQPTDETHGPIEFLQFDDRYAATSATPPPSPGSTTPPPRKELLLYVPGLEFSGVSAAGQFPLLATRYDLWRCRVTPSDRSSFDDLARAVVAWINDPAREGRKVTLLGESFGGLLALGVAQRLVASGRLSIVGGEAPINEDGSTRDQSQGGGETMLELTPVSVKKMKVAELKAALKDRDLSTDGIKADLTTRLLDYIENGEDEEPTEEDSEAPAVDENSSPADRLRGVVVVNPATSFDQTAWDRAIPILTTLPEAKFPVRLPMMTATSPNSPAVSPYSAAAAAVLGLTVPDRDQVARALTGMTGAMNGGDDGVTGGDGGGTLFPGLSQVLSPVKRFSEGAALALSALEGLADRLSPDTLNWRATNWLSVGCREVNPRIGALGADAVPVLAVVGEEDRLLPSRSEATRLAIAMNGSASYQAVTLEGFGHAALDDRLDLLSIIERSPLYASERETKEKDYVKDFVLPDKAAVDRVVESLRPLERVVSPVFVSRDVTGQRMFGLENVPRPSDVGRPVLLVGNHQFLALDLQLLIKEFLTTTDTLPRGLAHPIIFSDRLERQRNRMVGPRNKLQRVRRSDRTPNQRGGDQTAGAGASAAAPRGGGQGSMANFEEFGAVPVTPRNFYGLMASNATVLLFPGGVREANHNKGQAYQLFWPNRTDFVRIAAKFDALIVPFGAIGAADSVDILLDSNDLDQIPILGERLRASQAAVPVARRGMGAAVPEEEKERMSIPVSLPSLSGPERFYFHFDTPYDTTGIDPRDKEACTTAYEAVKGGVQSSIAYLLEARKKDSFRPLSKRLIYEQITGSRAPSFELHDNDVISISRREASLVRATGQSI